MSLLTFEGVKYSTPALELELNFQLHRPVTGIFGPSGAGKTTLLEMVAGLRRPRLGRVLMGETVVSDASARIHLPPERRHVGYVPQDLALFPHKTVLENLKYGVKGKSGTEPFEAMLQMLEIGRLLSRFPHTLSGGEKQRVALGRALMTSPRFLLLDEPLSSLDWELKERSLTLFRRLSEAFQVPMLYVSHDAGEVGAICDEVLVLKAGRVMRQGTFNDVFEPTDEPRYRERR